MEFRASIFLHFGIQSRHIFSVTTFRVVILSLGLRFMSLVLGVQSHSSLPVSGIRSHYLSIVWRSEPSSYVFSLAFRVMSSVLSVQSYVFNLAFRVTIFPHFGVQSNFSLALSFRVIAPTFIFTGIAHLAFTILHLSLFSSPHYLVLIACSSSSFRLPLPLHMTQSFEFTTLILVMLLVTLHLVFSCSSHRAIPFKCILSCTLRWFNRYSSLTSIFESLLEKS